MLSTRLLLLICLCTIAVFVNARKGFGPGSQEYGYVEVRKGAHMFYWLYYMSTVEEDLAPKYPLVFWLQGGPGTASSGIGNFLEIGPIDPNLEEREYAWTKHVNVLFIDSPVGTGFSYTDELIPNAKNNQEISNDLVKFTIGFYKKFPKFSKTPLYIFSESYGAKMAVQYAYDLHNEIQKHGLHINLTGVGLGSPWISPVDSCLSWAPYLLNLGAVDKQGYDSIMKHAYVMKKAVDNKRWYDAMDVYGELREAVREASGFIDFYNVLNDDIYNGREIIGDAPREQLDYLLNYKVKPFFKSVITTPHPWYDYNVFVSDDLKLDYLQPVTPYVEKILNNTNLKLLIFMGQLDLFANIPGTESWLFNLRWPGASNWTAQSRDNLNVIKKWPEGSRREGFSKVYDRLWVYWIDTAGHFIPADNPLAAQEMMLDFTGQYDYRTKSSS